MVLYENKITEEIKQLREIVKIDRISAKVFAEANKKQLVYRRTILDVEDHRVKITSQDRLVGISTTNKIYDRQHSKKSFSGCIVTKEKAYVIENGSLMLASLAQLTEVVRIKSRSTSHINSIFLNHMRDVNPVLYNIAEQTAKLWVESTAAVYWMRKTSSHFIVKHKYTNHHSLMRDRLGLPSKKSCTKFIGEIYPCNLLFGYKHILKHHELCPLKVPEDLVDLFRLSLLFGKTVDLSWSHRRITEEHDKLSALQLHHLTTAAAATSRPIQIRDEFMELATYSGWELIADTGRLAAEALSKKHCVMGYLSKIEQGKCAIFSVNTFTAEISADYRCVQLRGFRNAAAPESLIDKVHKTLESFKETKGIKISFSDKMIDRIEVAVPNHYDW